MRVAHNPVLVDWYYFALIIGLKSFLGRCIAYMRNCCKEVAMVLLAIVLVPCLLEVHAQAPPGTEAVNSLAFKLYARLAAQGDSANVFFSPLSISAAFAPIYIGARGNTKAELGRAFGFGAEGAAEALLSAQDLVQLGVNDDLKFLLANRLYVQEGFELKPQFTKQMPKSNGVETLDFAADPDGSLEIINLFVSDTTMGKIDKLLPQGSLNRETRMVVANSVFFAGRWQTEFNASQTEAMVFKGFNEMFNVNMMVLEEARLNMGEDGPLNNSQVSGPVRVPEGPCKCFAVEGPLFGVLLLFLSSVRTQEMQF